MGKRDGGDPAVSSLKYLFAQWTAFTNLATQLLECAILSVLLVLDGWLYLWNKRASEICCCQNDRNFYCARSPQRTKSRAPKGLQLEVRPQRGPRLQMFLKLHPRYSHDLFYIAPLLHLGLPLIHRLIMIDVDLVFRKSTISSIATSLPS